MPQMCRADRVETMHETTNPRIFDKSSTQDSCASFLVLSAATKLGGSYVGWIILSMLKNIHAKPIYSGWQHCCVCSPNSSCCNSPSPSWPRLPTEPTRPGSTLASKRRKTVDHYSQIWRRSYATPRGTDFRDNMNWPRRRNDPNPFVPSPYEIFGIDRRAVYTKHRYYELVKIYHPDRAIYSGLNGSHELSHGEKLERYRLIVLAHEILSDPVKRRAYDTYGAGWGDKARSTTRHSRGYSTASGKTYGFGPNDDNSPFANATWEDWERWYRRQHSENQKQAYAGTYINHNAFAAFIVTVAVLTGILQATRAGQLAGNMADKQLAFTEETSRFMTDRASRLTEETTNSNTRVKHFLERRDPTRYGLKEEEEISYRRHFADDAKALPPATRREI